MNAGLAVLVVAVAGCIGTVGPSEPAATRQTAARGGVNDTAAPDPTVGGRARGAPPAPLRRLTRAQYANTVRDLLGRQPRARRRGAVDGSAGDGRLRPGDRAVDRSDDREGGTLECLDEAMIRSAQLARPSLAGGALWLMSSLAGCSSQSDLRILGPGDGSTMAAARLIAHWPLDELSAGATVRDSSGHGFDGTPRNGPTPSSITAPLQFANLRSLRFDGARLQHVDLAAPVPPNDRPQSVSLWFRYRASDLGTVSQDLAGFGDNLTSAIQIGLRWEAGHPETTLAAWKRLGEHLCNATLPAPDAWHHLAYTYDGATHVLYVDGAPADSTQVMPQTGPASIARIGNSPGGGEPFTGWIDDVRVYAGALTPNDVARLAAGLP